MHPSISLFLNNTYYDGKIIDGPNVNDHYNRYLDGCMYGSYSFIHIEDGNEEQSGQSINNMVKAVVAGCIVQRLEKGTLNTLAFE
jgi:senataxin